MNDYNKLIGIIKESEGYIISIFKDHLSNTSIFIKTLLNSLENEYNIRYEEDLGSFTHKNYNEINKKTVVVVSTYNKYNNYRLFMGNRNVIFIVIRQLHVSINTSPFSNELSYMANLILKINNDQLTVLKYRYGNFDQKIDILKLIRKEKINRINKIIFQNIDDKP